MKGRKPTKAEQEYIDKTCALGCVVCRKSFGIINDYVSPHHIDGKTKPGAHFKVIPLCGPHHQTGGYGVALHAGKKEFEYHHGTEAELLEYQNRLIDE